MNSNCVVVHYSEIGLKGKNRGFFISKLIQNIEKSLHGIKYRKVYGISGRIVMELSKPDEKKIKGRLQKVPGIAHFSFALLSARKIESIKLALDKIAKKQKIRSFAVSSVRSDKRFKFTSKELNEILGDHLRKRYGWKVNLSRPDTTFFVEITEKNAFVYTEKIPGLGGLPVTSSGKLVSLISGGIDSPVAAFELMKRGCSIVFVHFHNWTKQRGIVKDKVEKIVSLLSVYQLETRLYLIPFEEIQKQIIANIPAKYRMIIYRRIMFMIANKIAEKERALGFVTGDSVGQVASQTLENLNVIYKPAVLPVFSPLIGSDKIEIINKAKQIGTYELSILPYSDCCSFLVAKHPETRAKPAFIEKLESGLAIGDIINSAIKEAEIKKF